MLLYGECAPSASPYLSQNVARAYAAALREASAAKATNGARRSVKRQAYAEHGRKRCLAALAGTQGQLNRA
jgi:hypothetical protein